MKNLDLFNDDILTKIKDTCTIVRKLMVSNYGTGVNLAGHCIEASELIVDILKLLGYDDAHTVEGYCVFDDDSNCSDCGYEAHTWVEYNEFYIDVTAEQFNYYMHQENKFEPIVVCKGYPHGIIVDYPKED